MKNRNKLIIGLLIIGMLLFAGMRFFVIPHRQAKEQQYLAAQQNPVTHDLNTILEYKSKYMGDASNISNLFYHLPLNNTEMSFELFPKTLTLKVYYKDTVWNIGEEKVKQALLYNSTAAFALIDNLQQIDYHFSGTAYQVKRNNIASLYTDFEKILQSDQWKAIQTKMNDSQYIDKIFRKVFQS